MRHCVISMAQGKQTKIVGDVDAGLLFLDRYYAQVGSQLETFAEKKSPHKIKITMVTNNEVKKRGET